MEAHIVHPKNTHAATMIWLHGLGADGFDFAPAAEKLDLLEEGVKFIFPHAPVRPITLNQGYPMRGWYDIYTLNRENFIHDVEGIEASCKAVHALIESEIKQGMAPHRIVLAGFSQGGAIALFAGLTFSHELAGILALSTYLPAPEVLAEKRTALRPPILMQHGTGDQVILPDAARESADHLKVWGYEVRLDLYPMAHSVCDAELKVVKEWLRKVCKDKK